MNGVKIGKGNSRVLDDNDVISVTHEIVKSMLSLISIFYFLYCVCEFLTIVLIGIISWTRKVNYFSCLSFLFYFLLYFSVFLFKDLLKNEQQDVPEIVSQKYYISRVLGQGACGTVKLVYDKVCIFFFLFINIFLTFLILCLSNLAMQLLVAVVLYINSNNYRGTKFLIIIL